jgi:cysteine desulfurase
MCQARKVPVFSDATQVAGKIACHPQTVGLSAIALSGHKFYGPKGIGALWLNPSHRGLRPRALLHGGGQEANLRPGTLNVPGIVGLGAAATLLTNTLQSEHARLKDLRDFFEASCKANLEAITIHGQQVSRLPHISYISFRFVEAEALLSTFHRRLAVSTGSACSSQNLEPSHVLTAMGCSQEDAKAAVRISLGRDNTRTEIETAVELLSTGTTKLRAESPTWELFQDGILS